MDESFRGKLFENIIGRYEFDASSLSKEVNESLLFPQRRAPQLTASSALYTFPKQGYTKSDFNTESFEKVIPSIIVLCYLLFLSGVLQAFIQEKETKMREMMMIMGVKTSTIFASWFTTYAVFALICSVLQAAAAAWKLFRHSNFVLLLMLFLLFGLSLVAFGFLISVFCNKSKSGLIIGLFTLTLCENLPQNLFEGTLLQFTAYVLPVVGFSSAIKTAVHFEGSFTGLTFANVSEVYGFTSVLEVYVMLVVQTILFVLLGLYFDQILPKEFGTAKPWNFLFVSAKSSSVDEKQEALLERSTTIEMSAAKNVEPVSRELLQQEGNNQALVIRGLRKVFGSFVAVKSFDMSMYQNQIFALLGHNGAGKSTIISMLTGMYDVTAGDANVRGKSLVKEMDAIRQKIGYCPQHDILYDTLTVEEHLMFYARIKNVNRADLKKEISKTAEEVGLTEKLSCAAKALSGGMKRKLSVAIAYLGDSEVVFLDEPTSGMDPYSRRSTWELLQNKRQGRVTILTTHFMDEADLLGDRIAIMSEGELKCVGSSMFLKKQYGAGYILTTVLNSKSNVELLFSEIKSYVPEANIVSHVGTELSIQLPFGSSSAFPSLFRHLEASSGIDGSGALGVEEYGIGVTNMEEVFLKVAEDKEHEEEAADIIIEEPVTKGAKNGRLRFEALLKKRAHCAKRDPSFFICNLLLPILFILGGIALTIYATGDKVKAQRKLKLLLDEGYPVGVKSQAPYYCTEDSLDFCKEMMENEFTGAVASEIPTKSFANLPHYTLFENTYSSQVDKVRAYTGEVCFARGFGKSTANVSAPIEGPVRQYGAYIVSGKSLPEFSYTIAVNSTYVHAGPIFKSLMDNTYFQKVRKDGKTNRVVVNQYPLPVTEEEKNQEAGIKDTALNAFCTIIMILALSFVPAGAASFIVTERVSEAKQQQYLSGISAPMYWSASLLWDYSVYLLVCAVSLISVQAFSVPAFTGIGLCPVVDGDDAAVYCLSNVFAATIILFLLFGLAVLVFTYSLTFVFKNPTSAQNSIFSLNSLLCPILVGIISGMEDVESTKQIGGLLKYVFKLLFPGFNLFNGMIKLVKEAFNDEDAREKDGSALEFKLLGEDILFLAVQVLFFYVLTLLLDYYINRMPSLRNPFAKSSSSEEEEQSSVITDKDVLAEKHRVATTPFTEDLVRLEGLHKVYQPANKVAVRDLSFGLQQGACFGFLGVNGAGKTTTLKMITGNILPTSGNGYVQGQDIVSSQYAVRQRIGYCAQFDALLDLLTVREHLELYGRFKGYTGTLLENLVKEKLNKLELKNFEHTLSKALSGGNKRKLSVAIAVIGSPPVIFLDEPSTGMDPVARRFMWKVILKQRETSTVILTTHSMEECEALCDKAGIMVKGEFQCFGSVQHLKSRFGSGLSIDLRLEAPTSSEIAEWKAKWLEENSILVSQSKVEEICQKLNRLDCQDDTADSIITQSLKQGEMIESSLFASWNIQEDKFGQVADFVSREFNQVHLVERHGTQVSFTVAKAPLAEVFEVIEENRNAIGIEDYSVSQTTLEQIFNGFASNA